MLTCWQTGSLAPTDRIRRKAPVHPRAAAFAVLAAVALCSSGSCAGSNDSADAGAAPNDEADAGEGPVPDAGDGGHVRDAGEGDHDPDAGNAISIDGGAPDAGNSSSLISIAATTGILTAGYDLQISGQGEGGSVGAVTISRTWARWSSRASPIPSWSTSRSPTQRPATRSTRCWVPVPTSSSLLGRTAARVPSPMFITRPRMAYPSLTTRPPVVCATSVAQSASVAFPPVTLTDLQLVQGFTIPIRSSPLTAGTRASWVSKRSLPDLSVRHCRLQQRLWLSRVVRAPLRAVERSGLRGLLWHLLSVRRNAAR